MAHDTLQEEYALINALAHHVPLKSNPKSINTVAFRKHLSESPPDILTHYQHFLK